MYPVPRAKKPAAPPDDRPEIVQQLLARYGQSGYRADVRRLTLTRPQRWESLGRMDLTTNLEEDVRQVYGGGEYKCYTLESDGTFVKGAMIPFTLGGRPKYPDDQGDSPARPNADVARLEAAIEKLTTKQSDDDRIQRTIGTITAIITAVTPLAKALLERNNGGGGDVASQLEMLHNAEQRGRQDGKELGMLLAGGAEPGMGSVVAQYLPSIVDLMKTKRLLEAAPASATPVVHAPPAPAAPAPAPAPGEVLMPEYDWLPTLRPHYPALAAQGEAGTDPDLVASFALEQLNEELRDAIWAASSRDDFLPTMRAEFANPAHFVAAVPPDGRRVQLETLCPAHAEWADAYLTATVKRLTKAYGAKKKP